MDIVISSLRLSPILLKNIEKYGISKGISQTASSNLDTLKRIKQVMENYKDLFRIFENYYDLAPKKRAKK